MNSNSSTKSASEEKKSFMKRRSASLGLIDKEHISSRLSSIADVILADSGFGKKSELTPNMGESKYGDYCSTVALRLSKDLGEKPVSLAEKIVDGIKANNKLGTIFADVTVAPNGFINFKMSESFLMSELNSAIGLGDRYGSSSEGKNRTILVESPSANPDAPLHAGHLRNLFLGRSLGRLLERVGFQVALDDLVNDKGLKVIQMMWGIKVLAGKNTPQSEGLKPDHFAGKYYWLAKQKYEESDEVKQEVRTMQQKWEQNDPELVELWKKCMKWVYDGHAATISRIREVEAYKWFESVHYEGGKELVDKYLGKGVVEKLPDGAVVGRLEDYGLKDVVLLRSDGTALYTIQDVSLTVQKIEKFKPWRAIWVVGSDHVAHFHGLFALLEKLGIMSVDNLYHFAYGMVLDKNGKKIGKGHPAAFADSMLDIIHAEALKIMNERKKNVELKNVDDVAELVGQGALRFTFLSKDPMKDVFFDPESALSFTGRSGPYIMYAYSRGRSILRKVKAEKSEGSSLTNVDRELILKLLSYPEVVLSAANNYAPNVIADYLFDTANLFNNFYEKEKIVDAQQAERVTRAKITELTSIVLSDGMRILGIEPLEQM